INAELKAIFYGLEAAWNEDFIRVMCEYNCKTTLTLIEDGLTYSMRLASEFAAVCSTRNDHSIIV
ncbi:hypothetical protein RYX36_019537, partial [Vicia faba]